MPRMLLTANGTPTSAQVVAAHSHLGVLQWARANGCEWDARTFASVVTWRPTVEGAAAACLVVNAQQGAH